jgi:hypothetical protein
MGPLATVGHSYQAAQIPSEVGYAACFSPEDPAVVRLSDFLEEFDSRLRILIVFGCTDSRICSSIRDRKAGNHKRGVATKDFSCYVITFLPSQTFPAAHGCGHAGDGPAAGRRTPVGRTLRGAASPGI